MNRLELIETLFSMDEDEVYIRAEDGLLDDFMIESVEEQFDGFYTVTPACIALVRKDIDDRTNE